MAERAGEMTGQGCAAAMGREDGKMFGLLRPSYENLEHLERVETCVRVHFALAPDDLVIVSEDPGRLPGYPPLQTTVLFWSQGLRHRFVVFKPVAMVVAADLPVVWLRPALVEDGGECC
jgi:hypothetical protein